MTCRLYSRWNPSVISAHSLPPLLASGAACGERDCDLPTDTPTLTTGTQGLNLYNTVGGEILTFPDTPTTQGLSLWCFNTVRDPRGQL